MYGKDRFEAKYQFLINKRDSTGLKHFNSNKTGLFEGSFSWGEVNLTPHSYFKKNLSNIITTLYSC